MIAAWAKFPSARAFTASALSPSRRASMYFGALGRVPSWRDASAPIIRVLIVSLGLEFGSTKDQALGSTHAARSGAIRIRISFRVRSLSWRR